MTVFFSGKCVVMKNSHGLKIFEEPYFHKGPPVKKHYFIKKTAN